MKNISMNTSWTQLAAEEIAEKYLAEPCREVDDDGEICAWSIDPDVVNEITAIIARHADAGQKGAKEALRSMADVMCAAVAFVDTCSASPHIVAVAYCHNGEILSLPRPARHCHIIWAYGPMPGSESGFLTDQGEFVGRGVAYQIAVDAGQVTPKPVSPSGRNKLFSEDVW